VVSTIRRRRNGLSLLEVILAVAILGGAMAIVLELVSLGMKSAQAARLRSEANLLCDTKMAEISAGVLELQSYASTPIQEDPDWLFQCNVQESSFLGLLVVTMAVEQADVDDPVSVQMIRYMPDPEYDPAAEESSDGATSL